MTGKIVTLTLVHNVQALYDYLSTPIWRSRCNTAGRRFKASLHNLEKNGIRR